MALALRNSYTNPSNTVKGVTGVAVTVGDLIIVAYRDDGSKTAQGWNIITTTCADTAAGGSNTYLEVGIGDYDGNATSNLHVFYAIAKATETIDITLTNASASVYAVTTVHVVSGALQDLNKVLDVYAFSRADASLTSHKTRDITTTNANDYIFVFVNEDVTNSVNFTDGSGGLYTLRQTNNNYNQGGPSSSFDRIVSSVGTYNHTITASVATFAASVIVAFKANIPDINSFTATPSGINAGGSAQLSWDVANATSVSINQGIGIVASTGTINVSPSSRTTYTLTATNADGTVQSSLSVGIISTVIQLNAFQNNTFQVISAVQYNATQMFMMF